MSEDQDNKPPSKVEAVADTSASESESESKSKSKSQEEETPPASVDNKPTSPTPSAAAAKSDIEEGVSEGVSATAPSPNNSLIPGAFAVNNPLFDDERVAALGSSLEGGATFQVEDSTEDSPTDPQTNGNGNGNGSGSPAAEDLPRGLPVASMATVAVAVAVENEPSESAPGEQPKTKQETKTIVFAALIFFFVVVLAVAIGVLSGGDGPSPLAEVDDDKLLEDRYSAMIALLAPLSDDGPGVFDPNHPDASPDRISALRWIVEDDTAQLPVPQRTAVGGNYNDNNGPDYDEALWRLRQRYVMGLLYFATNGENWFEDYKFLSDYDVCRWSTVYFQEAGFMLDEVATRGALCDEDDRVSLLQLYWNNLSGTIPDELSLFSDSLTELNIGGGHISGTIPSSLSRFSNLEMVSLAENCLTGSIPEGLDKISSLIIMIINSNSNQLTGSMDGFCYNATTYRENVLVVSSDFDTACDCCVSCNPDNFDCSDASGMFSYKSWNMGGVDALRTQFEKECASPELKEWISEECPCVINTSPDMEALGFRGECDANCTHPEPDYVYNG